MRLIRRKKVKVKDPKHIRTYRGCDFNVVQEEIYGFLVIIMDSVVIDEAFKTVGEAIANAEMFIDRIYSRLKLFEEKSNDQWRH
jgi:hypothetical protein